MHLTQPMLAAGLLFSLTTLNAEAALTPYTSAGENLVYSSVSNLTWTQDANLFKTLYDADNTLVNQIASITPSYNDPVFGVQTIDKSDFDSRTGGMTWFGGIAFINYLNSINYGGSNQWRLPSAGSSPAKVGYNQGSELSQLFYSELGGTTDSAIPNTPTFNNEQTIPYWSGTEYAPSPYFAWILVSSSGNEKDGYKANYYLSWAVTPGQVTVVPVPGAIWMFGTGLLGLVGLKRRGLGNPHSVAS